MAKPLLYEQIAFIEACINVCFMSKKHPVHSIKYKAAEGLFKEASEALINLGFGKDELLNQFKKVMIDFNKGTFIDASISDKQWGFK